MTLFPILYLNENIQIELVEELANLNFKAIHTLQVDNGGATDEFQLQYAANRKYIMVSYNRSDYRKLHNAWLQVGKSHYGIIVLSPGDPKYVAYRIKVFFEQKYSALTIPFCEIPPA